MSPLEVVLRQKLLEPVNAVRLQSMSHIVVQLRIESRRSMVYSIVDFDKLLFSIPYELQRSVDRGIVTVHEALDLPSTPSSAFGNPFPTIACPRLALA